MSTLAAVLAGAVQTFGSPRRAAAVAAMTLTMAAGATGCGSDSSDDVTIPQDNSKAMLQALDAVETACNAQNSAGARAAANDFVEQVNALPEEVGKEAKDSLRDAGMNLETLTTSPQCADKQITTSTTSTTEPTTSTPTTTETTTTSTTTTEETSTDETGPTEPPPAEKPPPDQGNGGGNQGPGGSGGSGGVG